MNTHERLTPKGIAETEKKLVDIVQDLSAGTKKAYGAEKVRPAETHSHISDLESRLLRILENTQTVSGGRVQAVGLQEIKQRLGRKWPLKRDLVHRTMKSIIQRKVSKQDVFFRRSDEEYIIVFAHLGLEPAKFVCAGIMTELNERFLGSADTKDIVVKTAVGAANGKMLFEEARLDKLLDNFSEMSQETAEKYVKNEVLKKHVASMSWEYAPKDPEADQVPPDFEIIYSPIWDVKREILTTYIAGYIGYNSTGKLHNGYSLVSNPKTIAAMDRTLLDDALATMEDLFRNNFRIMVCVPVHYESVFTEAHLYKLVERLKAVHKALRNYLILACDSFPPGVPLSKFAVISAALRPYCRNLAINVDIDHRDFNSLAEAGFSIVGCRLPRTMLRAAEAGPRIAAFANAVKRRGLLPSFLGVKSLELAEIIRHSGAQHIMGSVIGEYDYVPGHMVRMPWKDIVAKAHARQTVSV